METETEKYFRRKNRDLRFGRWLAVTLVGLPFAIFFFGWLVS